MSRASYGSKVAFLPSPRKSGSRCNCTGSRTKLLFLRISIVVIQGSVGLRPGHSILHGLSNAPVIMQPAGIFAVGQGSQAAARTARATRSTGTARTAAGAALGLQIALHTGVAGIAADAHIRANLLMKEQPAAVLKDKVSAVTLPQAAAATLSVVAHCAGNQAGSQEEARAVLPSSATSTISVAKVWRDSSINGRISNPPISGIAS